MPACSIRTQSETSWSSSRERGYCVRSGWLASTLSGLTLRSANTRSLTEQDSLTTAKQPDATSVIDIRPFSGAESALSLQLHLASGDVISLDSRVRFPQELP